MAAAALFALGAGVVAALVGWLTNRLAHPAWLTGKRAVALIAVLVVVGATIGAFQSGGGFSGGGPRSDSSASAQMVADEEMMVKVNPGETFDRVKQLLGQEPDRKVSLRNGFIAQFEREWGFIQPDVDEAGDVIAIAIIAKVDAFRIPGLGSWPSPFGKTISEYEDEAQAPVTGLISLCGASRTEYLEIYDTASVSHSLGFRSVAVGQMDEGPIDCAHLGPDWDCYPDDFDRSKAAAFSFSDCLKSVPWDDSTGKELRRKTSVRAVVYTEGDVHITIDMLRLPSDFGT